VATNSLKMSKDGIDKLEVREALVDGLYDDSSGYGTYGVGHLVHSSDKWKSLLLDSAESDKLCESRVKKKWPGTTYETTYLEREAIGCQEYDQLKTKAKERAMETIAQAKFKKAYKDLSDGQKAGVKSAADDAVDKEAQLLNLTVEDVFGQDLKPYETAVNSAVTGIALVQEEFDALVSFTFNVGVDGFQGSSLLKKINENKYRSGEAADREKAIGEIESAFLAWNKSKGKVVDGLTKRRQDEADQFLSKAREELKAEKAAKGAKGALYLPRDGRGASSELAFAQVRGIRPNRPA
jgi:lysozyme